jgi:DNA (cytosine-5)-methyltransferase 1
MNYLDLFSGAGGFHLGLKQAGIKFNKTFFSEIDKNAIKVYKKQFPNSIELGDINNINEKKLPKIDLVTFGFPCQDISIAGYGKGLSGPRSSLFNEAIRIISWCKPEYFIFENVKNLFSVNKGKDFKYILRTVADIGYNAQWQLINTNWFLPQNRERIYFIGYTGKKSTPKILPIGQSKSIFKKNKGYSQNNISTITAKYSSVHAMGETYIKDNIGKRRLTPIECERLQGFTDNYTLIVSDTARYKLMGNAVTVPVVKEIFINLKKYLNFQE